MSDLFEPATRGIGVRPDAGGQGETSFHVDRLEEFKPINILGLSEVESDLEENGFTCKALEVDGKPVQLLVYQTEEIELAQRLSLTAKGNVLPQATPEGIIWDRQGRKYLAIPVVWTDAKTEKASFTIKESGAVQLQTTDRREEGGRSEIRILKNGGVYTERAWRRQLLASQLAVENLGFPPGLQESSEPIQWSQGSGSFFGPNGLYGSPPGTRYGFMGWVRPKKN